MDNFLSNNLVNAGWSINETDDEIKSVLEKERKFHFIYLLDVDTAKHQVIIVPEFSFVEAIKDKRSGKYPQIQHCVDRICACFGALHNNAPSFSMSNSDLNNILISAAIEYAVQTKSWAIAVGGDHTPQSWKYKNSIGFCIFLKKERGSVNDYNLHPLVFSTESNIPADVRLVNEHAVMACQMKNIKHNIGVKAA